MFQNEFLLRFLQHLPQGEIQTTINTSTSSSSDIAVCEDEGIKRNISAKKIVGLAGRGAESPPSFNSEASCISNSCCTANLHQHHFQNKEQTMMGTFDGGSDIMLPSDDVTRNYPFLLPSSINLNPINKKGTLDNSQRLHGNVDFDDMCTWGADQMSQRVQHSFNFNPAVNAGQYVPSPNTNRFMQPDHMNANISNTNECPLISTTAFSSNNMSQSQTWVKQEAQEALSVNTWLQNYFPQETPSWGELQPSFSLFHSASNHRIGEEKPLSKEIKEAWRPTKASRANIGTPIPRPLQVPHEALPLKRPSHSIAYKPQAKKERIADRIPVLQQLVSPFGKTDTASVLQDTIDNIKFLHNQVQMLSNPFFKFGCSTTATNEPNKMTWGANISGEENGERQSMEDLSGRGLCLVPLSSTMHLANSQPIADYWASSLGGRFNQ